MLARCWLARSRRWYHEGHDEDEGFGWLIADCERCHASRVVGDHRVSDTGIVRRVLIFAVFVVKLRCWTAAAQVGMMWRRQSGDDKSIGAASILGEAWFSVSRRIERFCIPQCYSRFATLRIACSSALVSSRNDKTIALVARQATLGNRCSRYPSDHTLFLIISVGFIL